MADRRRRELERAAQQGDAEAAEKLYWDDLRTGLGGTQLLDKVVEALLTLTSGGQAPSVWEKIAFVRGLPSTTPPEDQIRALTNRYRRVAASADLHRIPRILRQAGFTTYVQQERSVYRLSQGGEWERLVTLSAEPPAHPFYVVQTLADRNSLRGGSCLVLANGGIYESRGVRGPSGANRHSSVEWASIRFEKIRR